MQKKLKDREILAVLQSLYPDAGPELNFTNPYETLVATILSAQCTDRQVNSVTPRLFADFPDVKALAESTPEEVYPYVRSCGFKKKAENIVMSARKIMTDFGGQIPGDLDALQTLPGVGRKTANVVYANAFGGDAIAVDTHVFRVSNRLGLVTAKDVLSAEKQLMEVIPRKQWSKAHHWLILHGRRVCMARKPKCGECPLEGLCRYAAENAGLQTEASG